jgi:hypothetical protein
MAYGCQGESNASFDDTNVPSLEQMSGGKGGTDAGGTGTDAGTSAKGGDAANGGDAGKGGKGTGGAGGKGMGGAGGKNTSGDGGTTEGGTMTGGSAGMNGGNPPGGMAGMAGTGNPPEPVTIKITDIVDASVSSCMVNTNYGSDKVLNVDGDVYCVVASLLQATLTAIPAGATVTDATLSLNCINEGDPLDIYYVGVKWSEAQVRWSNRPTVGALIGTLACTRPGQKDEIVTLDLTAAVVAWLSGAKEQNGIYLTTKSTDGMDFDSTEADSLEHRPVLSVTYTPAAK